MEEKRNLRNIVLTMLVETLEKGRFSHAVLNETLKEYPLEAQEKRFLSALYSGTIEQLLYLDYVINRVSKTPTDKMKPVIRNLLRMTVYQMLFMDAVPDRAAVSEALKICQKRKLTGLKPFVNGVLRTIGRMEPELLKEKKDLPFSVRYSVPAWICDKIEADHGKEVLEQYLQAVNAQDHFITVRILRAKDTKHREEVIRSLRDDGCTVSETENYPAAVRISNVVSFTDLSSYKKGWILAQDLSSMLVAEAIEPEDLSNMPEPENALLILDVCAAPGGKSIDLADRFPDAKIVAMDLSETKTALIRDNTERLRISSIQTLCHDAETALEQYKGKADVVICDLPCSGLGVTGRKADIRYRLKEEDIASLAILQRKILLASAEYVRPGGTLVFSTCTVTKEENEENAFWFAETTGFRPVPLKGIPAGLLAEDQIETCKKGFLQLINGVNGMDGFFISKFRKEPDPGR